MSNPNDHTDPNKCQCKRPCRIVHPLRPCPHNPQCMTWEGCALKSALKDWSTCRNSEKR